MTLEEMQETDPRFERRRVVLILSEWDVKACIVERETEGWDLYFRQTLFDREGVPGAMDLRFRRPLEAQST